VHVTQLWRYPVKSMIGRQVDTVELSPLGIVGDRRWAVRDLERGGIRGAKQLGPLMQCRAVEVDAESDTPIGQVEIEFRDGRRLRSDDPAIDAALSAFLGRTVRLESLPGADDLDHFRRGAPDHADPLEEFRAVMGRDPDEPLPDPSVFPPEIFEFESPPGTHHDAWPLLVMTTSALRSLAEALPDSVVDVLRFRPSILVDTGELEGHPEFGWRHRSMRVGTAELELLDPCPRCVMVTREVTPDIPADRAVLRHIVRDLDQAVGIYARITTPGRVSVGDAVELG
jgi:uncharacterized protein YcbX